VSLACTTKGEIKGERGSTNDKAAEDAEDDEDDKEDEAHRPRHLKLV